MKILEIFKGEERLVHTLAGNVNTYGKYKLNIKNIVGEVMLMETDQHGNVNGSILEIKEYTLHGQTYKFKANVDSDITYEIF